MIKLFFINENKDGWYHAGTVDTEKGEVVVDNTEDEHLDGMLREKEKNSAELLLRMFDNHYAMATYDSEDEEGNTEKSSSDFNVINLNKNEN